MKVIPKYDSPSSAKARSSNGVLRLEDWKISLWLLPPLSSQGLVSFSRLVLDSCSKVKCAWRDSNPQPSDP